MTSSVCRKLDVAANLLFFKLDVYIVYSGGGSEGNRGGAKG